MFIDIRYSIWYPYSVINKHNIINQHMKKGSTFFLRAVIAAIALFVIALCVYFLPMGIITDQTGLYRPVLMGMYLPAIPFFIALYQGLLLLNYIDKNTAFSDNAVRAFRTIKYCALTISGLYILGLPWIFRAADIDDAPGVLAIALVIIFASFVIATFSAVLQRLLQNVVEIKSENELTV